MSGISLQNLQARLRDWEIDAEIVAADATGEMRLTVAVADMKSLLERLQADEGIAARRLLDLTAIDRSRRSGTVQAPSQLEVIYRLQTADAASTLRIHAPLDPQALSIDSVTSLWPAANWLEREVFDLFGIEFRGHPNLRRLLLEANFEGAPLRHDFVPAENPAPTASELDRGTP